MEILKVALCAVLLVSSPMLVDRNVVDLLLHAVALMPLFATIEVS